MTTPAVDVLLAGPQGRSLCDGLDPEELIGAADDVAALLLEGLVETVEGAVWWGSAEEHGWHPVVPEAQAPRLRPVAEVLLASPAVRGWGEAMDPEDQWLAWSTLADGDACGQSPGATARRLATWREDAVRSEQSFAAHRARHPGRRLGGEWWSVPACHGLVSSSPSLDRAGGAPAGLLLMEDSNVMDEGHAWRVTPPTGARVLEVRGPDDWVELVRAHPFEVTDSRCFVWWEAVGRTGRWAIPDWQAVARDVDAVHLTTWGYLTTAGRVLPVDQDVATLLAGWDPGTTWWLTDVHLSDRPVAWARGDGRGLGWYPRAEVPGPCGQGQDGGHALP